VKIGVIVKLRENRRNC